MHFYYVFVSETRRLAQTCFSYGLYDLRVQNFTEKRAKRWKLTAQIPTFVRGEQQRVRLLTDLKAHMLPSRCWTAPRWLFWVCPGLCPGLCLWRSWSSSTCRNVRKASGNKFHYRKRNWGLTLTSPLNVCDWWVCLFVCLFTLFVWVSTVTSSTSLNLWMPITELHLSSLLLTACSFPLWPIDGAKYTF